MSILFISDGICLEKNGKNRVSNTLLNTISEIIRPKKPIILGLQRGDSLKKFSFPTIKFNESKFELLTNLLLKRGPVNAKIRREVANIIIKNEIKIVFIDESYLGSIAKLVKYINPGIQVITFFHNVRANLSKRWLKEHGIKYLLSHFSFLSNEKHAVTHSDTLITLNKRETNELQKSYQTSSAIEIPICLEDQHKPYNKGNNDDLVTMLFVGTSYYPNVKGISWFINEVLPHISGKLTVIGKDIDKKLPYKNSSKLNIVGTVNSTTKYYNQSDIVVSPIFEGAGMKVKTAEALMHGKYIFGTKEAFEGYNLCMEEVGGLCNNKEEFINKINQFIRHRPNSNFNTYSREYYKNNFSLEKLEFFLRQIIETL